MGSDETTICTNFGLDLWVVFADVVTYIMEPYTGCLLGFITDQLKKINQLNHHVHCFIVRLIGEFQHLVHEIKNVDRLLRILCKQRLQIEYVLLYQSVYKGLSILL